MSRWFVVAGILLIFLGAALHYAPWLLSWFGKLPGDIRIESERYKIYIPITSMLLVSVVATILFRLFRR